MKTPRSIAPGARRPPAAVTPTTRPRRAKTAKAPGERPPPSPPLGAHVSVAGGLATAFPRAADLGCDTIQIFVKNANQWRARPLAAEDAAAFRAAHAASGIGTVMAHASYLINLAATDPHILEQSLAALADELERCSALGVGGLVLHPGAHLGTGDQAGCERVAAALDRTLAALPAVATRILLENTAGQGTCLAYRLEHLADIRARLTAPHRVGICIDTCHAFAAGYALHEPAGWRDFVAEMAARFPGDTLACIHVNDSLRAFGSRRDRHAHIGEGEIGLDAFARLLAEPALAGVPMILETEPGDDMAGHRRDLATLRGLTSRAAEKPAGSSKGRSRSRPSSASG
jgi:deoxyribonuclease IV